MIEAFTVFYKGKKSIKINSIIKKKIKFLPTIISDLIIVIGGDGFMLQTMKKFCRFKKPFYGINSGSYGFLMNKFSKKKFFKKSEKN